MVACSSPAKSGALQTIMTKQCAQCFTEKSVHLFTSFEWGRPEGNKRYCLMCSQQRWKKYVARGPRADVGFNCDYFPGSRKILV